MITIIGIVIVHPLIQPFLKWFASTNGEGHTHFNMLIQSALEGLETFKVFWKL